MHLDLKWPISPQLEHLTRATEKRQQCFCPHAVRLTVSGLGAASGLVTILVAVTTLDLGHVARLRTLTRSVTLAVAVAANGLFLLGTVSCTVALLATIVAGPATTATLRAISREVTSCWNVRNGGFKEEENSSLSPHLRHSTFSALGGSGPGRLVSKVPFADDRIPTLSNFVA